MLGVIPLGASSVLPPADTVPAPGSSGVAAAGAEVTNRPDDAEYAGAVAMVDAVVESSLILPNGVGFAGTTTFEVAVGPFIEVGPISVVLNGVSGLPPDGAASYALGFSGPGGAAGPPYGAFRSAAGETGIEKLGL